MKTIIVDKIGNKEIHLKKGEKILYIAILKKGWKSQTKLTFHLEGENSAVTFLALITGKNNDKFPFETASIHKAKNTYGHFYIRSVLFENSEINFSGNANILPSAKKADSYVSHHTLILSPGAKANTLPALKIETNDVTAGHSASIEKADKNLLFYLESRGISPSAGQKLLVKSFLEKDLHIVRDKETIEKISKKL
ncbi:MAG: SufD family Fe-S cluster assembly protein [Candidatus Peregrinibacteria bacterium]